MLALMPPVTKRGERTHVIQIAREARAVGARGQPTRDVIGNVSMVGWCQRDCRE